VNTIVAAFCKHPALLGWYLNDEYGVWYLPQLEVRAHSRCMAHPCLLCARAACSKLSMLASKAPFLLHSAGIAGAALCPCRSKHVYEYHQDMSVHSAHPPAHTHLPMYHQQHTLSQCTPARGGGGGGGGAAGGGGAGVHCERVCC
jgi:hypothetical protein